MASARACQIDCRAHASLLRSVPCSRSHLLQLAFPNCKNAFIQHSSLWTQRRLSLGNYQRPLIGKKLHCLATSKLAEEGRASLHFSSPPRKEAAFRAPPEQPKPVASFKRASFLLGLAVAASGLLRSHPTTTIIVFACIVFQSKVLPKLLTPDSVGKGRNRTAQAVSAASESTAVEVIKPLQVTEETLQPILDAAKREVRQEVVAAGVVGRLERIMRILPVIQEAVFASRDLARQASGETAAVLGVSTKINAEVVGLKRQMAVSLDTFERNLQTDLSEEIKKGSFQVTAAVKDSLEEMEGRIAKKVATSAEVLTLHQRLDTVARMMEDLSRTSEELQTLPRQVEALQEQLSFQPPELDQELVNLQCTIESSARNILEEVQDLKGFESAVADLRLDVEQGFQKLETGRNLTDAELKKDVQKMLDVGRNVLDNVQIYSARSAAACEEVKDLVVSQQSSQGTGGSQNDRLLAESLAKIVARLPGLVENASQELADTSGTAGLRVLTDKTSGDSSLQEDEMVDEELLQAQRAFQSVYAPPKQKTAVETPVLEPQGRSETQEEESPISVGQLASELETSQTDSKESSLLTTSVFEHPPLPGAKKRFEVPQEVEALTQALLSSVEDKLRDGVAPDKAFTGAIEEAPPGALEDVSWVFLPEAESRDRGESLPKRDSTRAEAVFEPEQSMMHEISVGKPELLGGNVYEERSPEEQAGNWAGTENGNAVEEDGSGWREPFLEAGREEAAAKREALMDLADRRAVEAEADDAFAWAGPSYQDSFEERKEQTNGRQAAHWNKGAEDSILRGELEEGLNEGVEELYDNRLTSAKHQHETEDGRSGHQWEGAAFPSRNETPFAFSREPQPAVAGWRTMQVPDLRRGAQLELERPPPESVLDLRSEQDTELLTSADGHVSGGEEGSSVNAAMGSDWADEERDDGWGYSQRRREGRTQGVNGRSPEEWDYEDEERPRGSNSRGESFSGNRGERYSEGRQDRWEEEGRGVNRPQEEEYWADSPRASRGREEPEWDEGPKAEASQLEEPTEVPQASGGWEEPLNGQNDRLQQQYEENLSKGLRLLEEGRKGLNGRSEVLIADRMFSDAALAFEDALAADPDSRMALLQLGSAFLDHGEMKLRLAERIAASAEGRFASPEEEEWLQAIFDQGGDPADVIGELREGSEELLKEAGSTFREAVVRDSRDAEALTLWGLALCFRGQSVSDRGNEQGSGDMRRAADELFQSGVQKFEAALAVNPALYTALLNWGFALRDRSRLRPITSVQRRKLLIEAVNIIAEVMDAGKKAGGEALMARQELPVLESELEMVEEALAASQAARDRTPTRTEPPITDQRPRRSSGNGWQDL